MCVQVTVKREDLTGSILTGNKVHNLIGEEGRGGGRGGVRGEDWTNL